MSFEEVWKRIDENQGKEFTTVKGLSFTYTLEGNKFINSRTEVPIDKSELETAYNMLPGVEPDELRNYVRGSNYIYAVLTALGGEE